MPGPATKDDAESTPKGAGRAAAGADAKDTPADTEGDTPGPATEDDAESAAKGAAAGSAVAGAKDPLGRAEDAEGGTSVPAVEDDAESAREGAALAAAEDTSGSAEDSPAAKAGDAESPANSAGRAVPSSAKGAAAGAALAAAKGSLSSAEDDPKDPSGSAEHAPAAKAGDAESAANSAGTAAPKDTSGSAEDAPVAKAGDAGPAAGGAGTAAAEGAAGAAAKDAPSSTEDNPKNASGSAKGAAAGAGLAAAKGSPGSAEGDPEGASGSAEGGEEGAPAKAAPLPAPRGDGKAVDTPTTALKSPAAEKPQVDQPTTMLKVGGKAKPAAAEQEAERTSRFVALKPDLKGPSPRVEETRAVPQVGPERTTQQPLPPKPPLDLLAELTNTPPPPETPVRTLVRRVKIWTPLVILLVVILGVVQATRPLPQPTLALTAKDSYTFEGGKPDIPWPTDGQAAMDVQGIGSFGSSGSGKPVPIASVAKVMTAYLILRDHPLKSGAAGPKIPIDKTAQAQSKAGQESTVDVTEGDKITQREALEGVLIASANNVARLLARWDAGSEKAFVAKMNAAAKGLGMSGTTYTDPSGLTNSTVSTAVDQVKLAKAAMRQPAFREVAAMMSYTDYKDTNHSNWNQLVGHNNVVGIKTGTTTSALGNLVFAAKQDVGGETRMIIGAVLRQPPSKRDNSILTAAMDSSDVLIRAGQGALKQETVLKKGTVVGYVDDGLGGHTPVEVTEDVKAAGWAGLKVKLSFTSGTIAHTAKAGTEVGSLTVGDGSSAGAVKVPVALRADLAEPGLGAKLRRIG
ncbi:D-alanyl-D-alanine carboxypeptidase [Streptomyces bauhiniae]|uniref:D-alanyl-D-alanine carboxypeptidase n=2 Tax=Streptomyces bauhiniae TaxID=2340725 RepID=A0A7K3QUP1_9ACTN|nr:D-alanyl-D-alanine carboxypeptidase [Streptomyces bauhiniae]NEB93617.1 D-alanyl-D-alanine carboxypeptidase [Streptomyces bauhiniae]